MELELALAAIQKCLTLLHDDLGPDTKKLWLINQSSRRNFYSSAISGRISVLVCVCKCSGILYLDKIVNKRCNKEKRNDFII